MKLFFILIAFLSGLCSSAQEKIFKVAELESINVQEEVNTYPVYRGCEKI